MNQGRFAADVFAGTPMVKPGSLANERLVLGFSSQLSFDALRGADQRPAFQHVNSVFFTVAIVVHPGISTSCAAISAALALPSSRSISFSANSIAVPGLAGEQVDACVVHHAALHPFIRRDLVFQAREAGHVADREQIVVLQHQRRRRADGGDDVALQMHLPHLFHQQRAVAETFCAFQAAGQHDGVERLIDDRHQRRVGQQFDAARTDDSQLAVAGNAGGSDFTPARTSRSMVVTASVSSLPGARQTSADTLIFIFLSFNQFKQPRIFRQREAVAARGAAGNR